MTLSEMVREYPRATVTAAALIGGGVLVVVAMRPFSGSDTNPLGLADGADATVVDVQAPRSAGVIYGGTGKPGAADADVGGPGSAPGFVAPQGNPGAGGPGYSGPISNNSAVGNPGIGSPARSGFRKSADGVCNPSRPDWGVAPYAGGRPSVDNGARGGVGPSLPLGTPSVGNPAARATPASRPGSGARAADNSRSPPTGNPGR